MTKARKCVVSKLRGKIYQSQKMEQWITKELETTQLGDIRRTKRLIKIVENLSAKPEASIPQASGTWAQTKATYDFWDSAYIKPSMI